MPPCPLILSSTSSQYNWATSLGMHSQPPGLRLKGVLPPPPPALFGDDCQFRPPLPPPPTAFVHPPSPSDSFATASNRSSSHCCNLLPAPPPPSSAALITPPVSSLHTYTWCPCPGLVPLFLPMQLLTGHEERSRRFDSIQLVATSLASFLQKVHLPEFQNTLWILHATRTDLLQGVLEHIEEHKAAGGHWGGGLVLAGATTHCALPSEAIEHKIRKAVLATDHLPVLRIEQGLESTMRLLDNYLEGANLNLSADDQTRTSAGIEHITSHVDFDRLLQG